MRLRRRLVTASPAFGLVAAVSILAPLPASAHPLRGQPPGEVLSAWLVDPWALLSLGLVTWLYARGVSRLWDRAGRGRGVAVWRFRSFCAGLLVAGLALLSPVHPAGASIFSAHMLQHELLILVAAPLLVLGAPLIAFAWALPARISRGVRRTVRLPAVHQIWRGLVTPVGAALVHAVALWVWHAPALYEATLQSEFTHVLQHASFFGSALLLWWVLLRPDAGGAQGGIAALIIFITMLHSNALGALMTFSSRPWYDAYALTAPAWGLTPLEDQQLGGVLMWVPAGMIYMGAILLVIHRWLQSAEA